jgi:dihydrodipicolinate synthase/N-acetylneuraminate lyase
MAVCIHDNVPIFPLLTSSVVLAGTNGEAVTLSHEEKFRLVSKTRKLATELGRPDVTVTLGCGGQSTREVIAETRLAAEAGADFALVLVPSYFHFAMNEDAIVEFFQEVSVVHDRSRSISDSYSSLPMLRPFPS